MNVCMRHNKQTNMVITSQANLIALACYGNVAIFFIFFFACTVVFPRDVANPGASSSCDWSRRGGLTSPSRQGGAEPGEFCGGGARRGGAGLFILGAMLLFLFFLFSLVFLSRLLNSQSDRGEDAAYEPTNYTLVASGLCIFSIKKIAFFSSFFVFC